MSDIYIFGIGKGNEILNRCLKDNVKPKGYIDNDVTKQHTKKNDIMVYSVEELDKNIYVCISVIKYKEILNQLTKCGFNKKRIIPFFSIKAVKSSIFRENFFVTKWITELVLNSLVGNWILRKWKGEYFDYYISVREYQIEKVEKLIIIGSNKFERYFVKKVERKINKDRILIIDKEYNTQLLYSYLNDIFYDDKCKIIIVEPFKSVKIKGDLIEVRIQKERIITIGQPYLMGAKFQNSYDVCIGYTWKSDLEGFVKFGSSEKGNFRIVTLGGSTTDATLYNIKSWSEHLYEILRNMDIKVEIICGGIAAYTVSQELIKLIKDVRSLEPDLVISYSGINNATGIYNVLNYPFVLKYQKNIIESLIQKKKINNEIFSGVRINKLGKGIKDNSTQAEHWLDCERMMYAICKEFGIDFLAFLQPYNKNYFNEKESLSDLKSNIVNFYKEIKINRKDTWMHDFTDIFAEDTDVFTDYCHVYEYGNRKIARSMLPYILKSIAKSKDK